MFLFCRYVRVGYRIALLVIGTIFLVLAQAFWTIPSVIFGSTGMNQSPLVRLWYRYLLKVMHITVSIDGWDKFKSHQKIILSNHISYIDILVLGACFDAFFVAKMDIAGWPVFGFLARLGGTVFITRKRQDIKTQLNLLQGHLKDGKNLLIFPEGTTGNGRDILPFKSSLLKAAFAVTPCPVIQPVTLRYTKVNGAMIQDVKGLDIVAWYGDMSLGPHFMNLLGQKSVHAQIIIHPALRIDVNQDSKMVSNHAYECIKAGLESAQ